MKNISININRTFEKKLSFDTNLAKIKLFQKRS